MDGGVVSCAPPPCSFPLTRWLLSLSLSYSPFTSSSRNHARTRTGGLRGFDPGAFQLLVISADVAEYGMPGVSRVKYHRDKAAAAD